MSSSSTTTPQTETDNSSSSVSKRWFPLESNPVLLNRYVAKLGIDTARYSFVDVFSTDAWALEMIPPKTAAVMMLYPISAAQETHRHEEELRLGRQDRSDRVWHTKQRIGNACGTIGILHSLANLPPRLRETVVTPGGWTDTFLTACPASLTSVQKADVLEGTGDNDNTDGSSSTAGNHGDIARELESLHDAATSDATNQTARGDLDDELVTHFVALVHVDGGLYELDGRKSGPVRHGNTTEDTLLRDACGVVKQFMARDPGEMRFTILALAPTTAEQ